MTAALTASASAISVTTTNGEFAPNHCRDCGAELTSLDRGSGGWCLRCAPVSHCVGPEECHYRARGHPRAGPCRAHRCDTATCRCPAARAAPIGGGGVPANASATDQAVQQCVEGNCGEPRRYYGGRLLDLCVHHCAERVRAMRGAHRPGERQHLGAPRSYTAALRRIRVLREALPASVPPTHAIAAEIGTIDSVITALTSREELGVAEEETTQTLDDVMETVRTATAAIVSWAERWYQPADAGAGRPS